MILIGYNYFLLRKEFAKVVNGSDNYYLIITRNITAQLPISVDEIFTVSGNKNKKFERIYKDIDKMYSSPRKSTLPFKPQLIITEDSNSGFQFFNNIAYKHNIQCESAGGKSNILNVARKSHNKKLLIIADGAAFGSDISDIVMLQKQRPNNIAIYLPESFEWIILNSGVVDISNPDIINSPEIYADSILYNSWERYFTQVLIDETRHTEFKKYSKSKLSEYYLQDNTASKIAAQIKWIDFDS